MRPPKPWMPPFWLLLLDAVGALLLGFGLFAHYTPQAPLAQGFLASAKLPFIVFGGLLLAAGSLLAVKLVLQHRRSSR